MKPRDLETIWENLVDPAVKGDLVGEPAPESATGAMLAVDGEGRRHLLIPAPAGAEDLSQPPIRGIGVSVDDLRVDDRPVHRYFDVACKDMTMHENFSAVVLEILEGLGDADDVGARLDSIFNRWRWFWKVAPEAMSPETAIGLFGELWFMEFWLDPVGAEVLDVWTGPLGDRHDFKWPQASIEVKTTRVKSDGPARHRISRLDQLEDPESGTLHLFSLRVAIDEIGGHSLNRSIDRLREQLARSPELIATFEERIGLVGYNPSHAHHYEVPFRVVGEELYRVGDAFPRLTAESFSGGLPAGVDDVGYTVDLAACGNWRMATKPGPESRLLRSSLAA
jgi:hypothetical protein